MIHFIIGTKAQFVKMAPLMYLLEAEHRPYHLLDLGQHADITRKILVDFDLHPKISHLTPGAGNVESYAQAAKWLTACGRRLALRRRRLLQACFQNQGGVSLIHGDTVSTWLGLHLGRRAGLRTGLVEAGLTSGSLLDPFPEEMIRRYAEKRADMLFAPGAQAAARLQSLKLPGEIHDTGYNTGRDALALTIKQHGLEQPSTDAGTYSVLTLHRLETLSRSRRLVQVVRYVQELADEIGPIRFFLHGPTRLALTRYGLLAALEHHPRLELAPLLPYPKFIHQVLHCRFLLTDGGSIQEEAAYIDKPCLVLRRRTERSDGLGRNVRLARFDVRSDVGFLREAELRFKNATLDFDLAASRRLLAEVVGHAAD